MISVNCARARFASSTAMRRSTEQTGRNIGTSSPEAARDRARVFHGDCEVGQQVEEIQCPEARACAECGGLDAPARRSGHRSEARLTQVKAQRNQCRQHRFYEHHACARVRPGNDLALRRHRSALYVVSDRAAVLRRVSARPSSARRPAPRTRIRFRAGCRSTCTCRFASVRASTADARASSRAIAARPRLSRSDCIARSS